MILRKIKACNIFQKHLKSILDKYPQLVKCQTCLHSFQELKLHISTLLFLALKIKLPLLETYLVNSVKQVAPGFYMQSVLKGESVDP